MVDEFRRNEAEKARLELTSELLAGAVPKTLNTKGRIRLCVFYEEIRKKMYAETKSHRHTLRHLRLFFGDEGPLLVDIRQADVEGVKDYLIYKAGLSGGSPATYFDCLTAVLNHAVRHGLIDRNPAQHVKRPKVAEAETHPLEFEEVQKLEAIGCKHKEIGRAFSFAMRTGLRKVDLKRLQWKHVKGDELLVRQKKPNTYVKIPLGSEAKQLLGEAGAPDAYVFDLPSDQTISNYLGKWCRSAGIQVRTFHDSRHTYGYLLVNGGGDLYSTSKLLGHSSLRHTQRYAKLSARHLRSVAELNPLHGRREETVQHPD